MSDDRLYLRCQKCGDRQKLVSLYHDYPATAGKPTEERILLGWVNAHLRECWPDWFDAPGADPGFDVVSEKEE